MSYYWKTVYERSFANNRKFSDQMDRFDNRPDLEPIAVPIAVVQRFFQLAYLIDEDLCPSLRSIDILEPDKSHYDPKDYQGIVIQKAVFGFHFTPPITSRAFNLLSVLPQLFIPIRVGDHSFEVTMYSLFYDIYLKAFLDADVDSLFEKTIASSDSPELGSADFRGFLQSMNRLSGLSTFFQSFRKISEAIDSSLQNYLQIFKEKWQFGNHLNEIFQDAVMEKRESATTELITSTANAIDVSSFDASWIRHLAPQSNNGYPRSVRDNEDCSPESDES